MGASDKLPHLSYRFIEHALYLDEFIAGVIPKDQTVVLVLHDWGSGLGFHWARRNAHRVAGLAFMEFVPPMPTWEILDKGGMTSTFQAFRGPPEVGRKLLIEENVFVEKVLPGGVVRALSETEMEHYRAPYLEPVDREPVYRWPNEVPIEGKPTDVYAIAETYHAWLLKTDIPKLFFWATPGAIIGEELAGWYQKTLKKMTGVHIGPGKHYLQEDNPHLIGKELAKWMDQVVAAKGGESKV